MFIARYNLSIYVSSLNLAIVNFEFIITSHQCISYSYFVGVKDTREQYARMQLKCISENRDTCN